MPKHFPLEFKLDVVAVARWSGPTHPQVKRDLEVSANSVADDLLLINFTA
jgi:hypothetical protein